MVRIIDSLTEHKRQEAKYEVLYELAAKQFYCTKTSPDRPISLYVDCTDSSTLRKRTQQVFLGKLDPVRNIVYCERSEWNARCLLLAEACEEATGEQFTLHVWGGLEKITQSPEQTQERNISTVATPAPD